MTMAEQGRGFLNSGETEIQVTATGNVTDPLYTTMEDDRCVPLQQDFLRGVSVVPALVALENLFFLLAMILYRKKLKHHTVHRYVASALVANFVVSVLGFYHFLNYYYGFEPHEPNQWWAWRKGMTLSLSLIMCGNIGLLIYGIDDNTYIVGRITKPAQQAESLSPQYRRRKANWLIFLVWALPVIYGVLSIAPWNCTNECTCTLSYESNKPICPGSRCSRLYTPMAKSYLFVIVVFWALECTGLIFLLCKSCKILKDSNSHSAVSAQPRSKFMNLKKVFTKWRGNYGILFILFLLFFICTIPVMILGVLDFAFPQMKLSAQLVNFVTPLPLLYCLASPFLIAHKLSGVKNALLNIMAMICSHTKMKSKNKKKKTGNTVTPSIVSKELSSGNLV